MSTQALSAPQVSSEVMETVLVKGDLAALKPQERVSYYRAVCESLGLNPLTQPFAYIIDTLPTQLPIFDFIQKHGPVNDREAYGNLNMGAGFALYVPEEHVDKVVRIAAMVGQRAFRAGHIEASDTKKVVIKPKGLELSLIHI